MAVVEFADFQAFKEMKGRSLPMGNWVQVTQEMIDAFAVATRDDQWIHTDALRAARESPFGATVAHGFLSLSLIWSMISDGVRFRSLKMGVNYGLNRVRFPSPVLVNSRVRLNSRIEEIEETGNNGLKVTWDCKIELENSDRPACVCEFITLFFE